MAEKKKGRARRAVKYVVFIVIAAAAALGLKVFFDSREVITYEAPARKVETVKAERGTISESLVLQGYVMSESMVPVIPFVQGTIEECSLEAGDVVEKGQVVAVVDKTPFELQAAQARAQATATASAVARVESLHGLGAATDQDLETAKAQDEAAQAQLELAELQLGYAEVEAPISGTVIQANQGVGDVANSQTPVAVIADTSDLTVTVSAAEKHYPAIMGNRDSLAAVVRSTSTGAESGAEIVSIAPYVDPASKTFQIKLRITDPSAFTVGMNVKAEITHTIHEDVMTLPVEVRKPDGSMYVVRDSRAVYVEGGSSPSDGERFIAPGGFEDDDFIIEGQHSVLDGELVNAEAR